MPTIALKSIRHCFAAAGVALAATGFVASTASAQSPGCVGRNMLDELKASDPAVHAEIRAAADATPHAKTLLWKVETTTFPDRMPSYLYGTSQLTDDRLMKFSPAAIEAMDNAKRIALEVEDTSQDRINEALATLAKMAVAPADQQLDKLLNEPDLRNARRSLARSGLPADTMTKARLGSQPPVGMAVKSRKRSTFSGSTICEM